MAAISNRNLIPSSINTYERLVAWCMSVAFNLFGNRKLQIYENEPLTSQCSVSTIRGADGRDYWMCSVFLPYSFVDMNGAEKPWMSVQDVVEAQPHSNLTSN
jgi:hypothetical protein